MEENNNSISESHLDEEIDGYYVEKILSKRVRADGKAEYLIKWEGFEYAECTWELEDKLDCRSMIRRFENQLSRKRRHTDD